MVIRKIGKLACCVFIWSGFVTAQAQAPTLDPADDTRHLGPISEFLFWTPEQQVAGYRNMDKVFPTRLIPAGGSILELPENPVDLDAR
jgi:hypothetical protein